LTVRQRNYRHVCVQNAVKYKAACTVLYIKLVFALVLSVQSIAELFSVTGALMSMGR